MQSWPRLVRAQGALMADEETVVGVKQAGRVDQVNVEMGSSVRAGDVLALLDAEELDLRIEQAEALLAQARAQLGLEAGDDEETLDPLNAPAVLREQALLEEAQTAAERARQLAEKHALSAEELDQREAALRVAKANHTLSLNLVAEQAAQLDARRAELALARQLRTDAVIRAPFDGIVIGRHVGPGTYRTAGQPIATLVRCDPLRFRAGVPERAALDVQPGQDVRIYVEGTSEPVHATVTRISPSLDRSNRTRFMEAEISNPGGRLPVGLFAEADVVVGPDESALVVPSEAVEEFAGVEKVWLLRDDAISQREIRTGRRDGTSVEITAGLSPGDRVVADARRLAGPQSLASQ